MADIDDFADEGETSELTRCTITFHDGQGSVSKLCRDKKVVSCFEKLATNLGPLADESDPVIAKLRGYKTSKGE